jgi:hypothetical protein
VLGSTIIGLETHTPENINDAIAYAVRHNTDFHQFMLYTPSPGTPFYAQLLAEGRILGQDQLSYADTHGQDRFNYLHPGIPAGQETHMLQTAFETDFKENGPSIVRVVRTTLKGWYRHGYDPDPRVRKRYKREARGLSTISSALVKASQAYYRFDPVMYGKMSSLLRDLHTEFGLTSRASSFLLGGWMYGRILEEEGRLFRGITYEPPTFYEGNSAAMSLESGRSELTLCRSVAP